MTNLKPGEKELLDWLQAARAARRSCENKFAFDALITHQEARLNIVRGPSITYRLATLDDAEGIFALFQEVGPDIPLPLDTEAQQCLFLVVTGECINSKESWVAVDAAGAILGSVLARALPHKGKGLFLEYVGVRESWRGRGIFPGFMKKLKANGVPLTASVLHGNKSGMVDRFVKQGFTKGEADHKETKLSWA